MSKQNFEQLCMFALTMIGECMLKELPILGAELKLSEAISGYDETVENLRMVQTWAFADKILQMNDEPPRFFLHKGDPPLVTLT